MLNLTIIMIVITAEMMENLDGIDSKMKQETKCLTILQDNTIVIQDTQVG